MEFELHTLAYFSRSTLGHDGDPSVEIARILHVSQRNNHHRGITGALLYSEGCFAQVLEAPLSVVEEVFEKIERDHRHRHVTILQFRPLAKRNFGQWSMAFAGIIDPAGQALNINDVLDSPSKIEGAQAGRDLIAVLNDLMGKHDRG